MARSGSDNRQRQITLSARFTREEADLVRAGADKAGVSVAALIRYAILDDAPLPSSRSPSINHQVAGQMLAELARLRQEMRELGDAGLLDEDDPRWDAVLRDFAEMRLVWFEALGRAP